MSIGILISVHDGFVLAADSASTLMMRSDPTNLPGPMAPTAVNVYNNANKIANLFKGEPIGCVAYGSGSIGTASVSTLLKDFRRRLTDKEEEAFERSSYTMAHISKLLSNFLSARIAELKPDEPKPSMGIMLGGYSTKRSLAEGWLLAVENGVVKDPQLLRPEGQVGINWGGEQESLCRLVLGFSPTLPETLRALIKPTPSKEQMDQLAGLLKNKLQAPLAFAPMPIQDAIELAEWLVHTAEMFSRFLPGATSVGGPIEIAAITRHEGFRWVRRKYYFDQALNPEVRQ